MKENIVLGLTLLVCFTPSLAKAGSKLVDAVELSNGDTESLKKIQEALKNNTSPNELDDDGNPAIYWAVYHNDKKALKLLLQAHADPNQRDKHMSWTPLMHIVAKATRDPQYEKMMKLLISRGADVNASKDGITSLSIAVGSIHMGDQNALSVVNVLLDHNADPNISATPYPKLPGLSPLMIAARDGSTEVALLLVKHGARISQKGPDGKDAIDIAKERKHTDFVTKLERTAHL